MKDTSRERSVKNGAVSLALAGGGVAWFLHLALAYLVAEFGCIRGWDAVQLFGVSLVAWLILLVTILTLVGAVAATALSVRLGQRPDGPWDLEESGATVGSFSARAAFITNLIFVLVILAQSVPIFYFLRKC